MTKPKLDPAQPLDGAPPDVWSTPTEELQPGMLRTAKDVMRYMLAGKATFTLRSKKTGTRYTYNVYQKSAETPHFVKVMYGPDNTTDFVFLGTIFDGAKYRHGNKSPLQKNDIREQAFCYMWDHVLLDALPDNLEVWHEGRCGKCNRVLTVPESIARGIGPECATKM